MNRKAIAHLLLAFIGIGVIAVAVLAFRLGIDNDPGWGPRRFQMLGLGSLLVLLGTSPWLSPRIDPIFRDLLALRPVRSIGTSILKTRSNLRVAFSKLSPSSRVRSTRLYEWWDRNRASIGLVVMGLCALWLYAWVVTAGRFDRLPSGKNYYWLLAQAFQHGQTHLLVEPNPELLKLENPYDHHQRKGLDYLWDASLYDGKYFLYWGPVPGVIGAVVSLVTSRPVTDAGLVFAFVIGTALFSVLLLREMYQQFRFPGWLFWGGVIASCANIPLIWLLTRPTVYEASISGGQFFLMAGLYLAFCSFRFSGPHRGYAALSATALGLAGGTRINLLPSIVVLILLLMRHVFAVNQKKFRESIPALVSILVPIFLIFSSLLWYNYDRFGSIFEFGHRYQLTGGALPDDYQNISSVKYIVPNTFTYIFRLPSLSAEFPFLTVPWIEQDMWPFFIRLPENYYYTEPTAGILFIFPIVGLAVLLLVRLTWLYVTGEIPSSKKDQAFNPNLFSWLNLSLIAYVSVQMLFLLTFISSAMRYLFDISPALIVLCILFVGRNLETPAEKPQQKRWLAFLWILVSALTVLSGFLIGFTGDKNLFLNKNPDLYYRLLDWFN